MRAWATAEALGRQFAITLCANEPVAPPSEMPDGVRTAVPIAPSWMRRLRLPGLNWRPADWPDPASLPESILSCPFDRVHVFRFAMAPYAEPFLGRVECHLDLDEDEARTRARIAWLHGLNGARWEQRRLLAEAAFYRMQAPRWLPRFERIYVTSANEQDLLRRAWNLPSTVAPNSVPIPGPPLPDAPDPPVILLIGNLNYLPNADGVRHFIREIFPRVRGEVPGARFHIAGSGRAKLPIAEGVERLGFVPDLMPCYGRAWVCVAPIRAGGGVRIKILEAFAHGRAVVSTPMGAEGIEARPGQDLLLAESPNEFAESCVRLLCDARFRRQIAASGYEVAVRRHSPAAVAAAFT
jgi:glycosyltransferase involved in cell wall biosynthesis